jgi:Leucine-rich repeat (LRR) protein
MHLLRYKLLFVVCLCTAFVDAQTPFTSITEAAKIPDAVAVLHINNQGLTAFPDIIPSLKNLRQLSLSDNSIKSIPDISMLEKLEVLKLSANQINSFPCSHLPVGLKELELNYNKIEELDSTVSTLKKLERINLQHNKISILPRSFFTLTALNHLDISNNNIKTFPERLCTMPQLRSLDLSGNKQLELNDDFPLCENLKMLFLNNIPLPEQLVNQLLYKLPNGTVVH